MSKRHDNLHRTDVRLSIAIAVPAFAGRLVVRGQRAICYLTDREVHIEAPSRLLARLAELCDARTPMADIVAELGRTWNADDLSNLVDGLVDNGVLCEASRLAEHWWSLVRNPNTIAGTSIAPVISPPYSPAAHVEDRPASARGSLIDILQRRSSTRIFGPASVPYCTLLSILWASYGLFSHRTVPSAGGLYPLQIHFVNFRAVDGLDAGIYRLGFPDSGKVDIEPVDGDLALAPRAFIDCNVLFAAQGIIVVSGSLAHTALKYGTRAALYVPLEAGHVAQNILLMAAEGEVAAVEIGGFYERQLSALLKLPAGLVPLTSVILGSPPSAEESAKAADAPEIEFRWMETDQLPYAPPFFVGSARVKGEDFDWSWGRSTDPATAHAKASAEALERWSCTRPADLRDSSFRDLNYAVDPRNIVAYTAEQYARPEFPYQAFDAECTYLWKEGNDVLSGKVQAVLADCLYFSEPIDRRRPYTGASSSGAAAYPTAQGAMERAVLELIERDAFMQTWLGRATRSTIDPASLPEALSKRVEALRQAGVEVVLKDHSLDLTPVVFAFAQSSKAAFTVTTASAAYDVEEALVGALMELELAVAARLTAGAKRSIDPRDVQTPLDHADLYGQRRYYKRADFMGGVSDKIALSEVGCGCVRNWEELCIRLQEHGRSILWFDLTPVSAGLHGGRSPLVMGRAIVPGLIPISFGHGLEPLASFAARSPVSRRHRRSAESTMAPCMFPHPFG